MKKYLMTGIAALAMCAAFTSCSKDPGFDQTTPEQLAKAQYEAAFIKAFGQPAANQDWGFGTNVTRSVIKKDMTNYPTTGNPAPITAKEAEFVTKWFQENPGLSEEGKPWTNFYVQFVSGDQTNKKGIWHRHDINPQPNGRDWDEEFTDNGGMDKLHVGATRDQNSTDHINDFNAKTGGPWDVAYVKNGSALQWGYHSSWGEDDKSPNGDGYYWYFKMADIEVPGDCFEDGQARVGCYVGLSLYGKKYDNGDKELGYQRLQYAEDWILKITNADAEPEVHYYRVIAEDLNASEKTDFDFNDVVFDIIPNEAKTAAKIVLRAAGGIYKLTVAGSEVHEAFAAAYPDAGYGVGANGLYPMINTNPWNPEIKVTLFENYESDFSDANIRNTIRNIEIRVYKPGFEENGIELTATTGKPACKILVDDTFGVVRERFGIADEYNDFTTYVQGYFDGDFWWKSGTLQ